MYRTAAVVVLVLTPLSAGISQSSPDHALVYPIFRQYYSCGEHAAGELKYQGDDGAWKGSQALQVRFDLTALGAIRQQKN
jgi:hypothetical protein